MLTFLIGFCWLLKSFAEDMKENFLIHFQMRKSVKRNNSELKQCFCKLVQFYLDVKQLSYNYFFYYNNNFTNKPNDTLTGLFMNSTLFTNLKRLSRFYGHF